MRNLSRAVLFFLVLTFTVSESLHSQHQRNFKVGCIAFYNLENLFDTINDPDKNDEEFLPNGAVKWNSKKYLTKIERMAEAIESIGTDITPDGAAILGVSEIENKEVLLDLAASPKLKDRNYQVIHYHSPDLRGVDVGLLYQPKYFKPTGTKSYRLHVEGRPDFLTRDQLLVSGIFDGEEMHFIVNHWPSRRGGEKRSLPFRMAAAKLSRHIADSLLADNPNAKIVVMGDLNDNPSNKSLTDGLRAKGSLEELQPGDLYNATFSLYKKGIGSNAWRDTWSLFDQQIVSQGFLGKDFSGYTFYTVKVHNKTELTQKSGRFKGYPWRTYVGGEYHGGYSDHFPSYIIIAKDADK
ncbi:MAG TPA: endonuclease/exonuclease/phosphatase family protein [Bacteroidales bacterium]|nr:endonuclease/exonuclease/phosphatase family protein [Bacteroidales bacterium]